MSPSRNSACPCGSGRRYKRCCLAREERAAHAARLDDAVGRRIQDWSSQALEEEIGAAVDEFVGADRTMDDDDLQIFATWFHNDRELSGGGTLAERYAARADLPEDERAAASRIASAAPLEGPTHEWHPEVLAPTLGLRRRLTRARRHRRLSRQRRTRPLAERARSSREAVRWDILLGRVMDGDPFAEAAWSSAWRTSSRPEPAGPRAQSKGSRASMPSKRRKSRSRV
jgi:hypothetical protein